MSDGQNDDASAAPQDDAEQPAAREVVRERARELREVHRKKDTRRRWILRGGIAVATVAILASVAFVLITTSQTPRPGPQNMQSDGITIGTGLVAVGTPALNANETPVPAATGADGVIDVRIYVDYLCPDCGDFQASSGDQLQQLVDTGIATVEIHPLAMLTSKSAGTQYSLRAANAAACVAQFAPDQFYAFNAALLTDQPQEGSEGLTDTELVQRASDAGVKSTGAVTSCVEKRTFKNWVQAATTRAISGPLPGTDVPAITSALTVLVNGKLFTDPPSDPNAFSQFVLQAAGADFADSATPTPTPAPTP